MEHDKSNFLFFRFEDLRIYNKALDYICWVYRNTELFPESENNYLANKFINSAQKTAIYIAEGSSRSKSQFVYFLRMAKSSIRECIVFTTICRKLNFLSESSAEESRTFLMEMTKMIGALIASQLKNEQTDEKGIENDYSLPRDSNI